MSKKQKDKLHFKKRVSQRSDSLHINKTVITDLINSIQHKESKSKTLFLESKTNNRSLYAWLYNEKMGLIIYNKSTKSPVTYLEVTAYDKKYYHKVMEWKNGFTEEDGPTEPKVE